MAARTLKNEKDRLITLFIIGFMSCGARLPIYVLFAGAFFSDSMAGNVLFAIYISGAMLGLISAKILKMTAFKGEDEPFVMEMPKYRLPSVKLIWHTVVSKTMMYLKKAGTFIAGASMLIWFLSNYPHNLTIENDTSLTPNVKAEMMLEQSYLGSIGKFSEPLFEPLGFDWKMSVALQTGLAAKEVVVSTLGVLYSLGGDVDEENTSLKDIISKNISFASAVAFIVVIMIYLPCLAASVVFTREAGGIKYFFYLFGFTSFVAYTFAFIAYHIALVI
jgi:ferrous iron transport protein B